MKSLIFVLTAVTPCLAFAELSSQLPTDTTAALVDDSIAQHEGHDAAAPAAEPKETKAPVAKDAPKTEGADKPNPLASAVQARTPEEQALQSGFQFAVSLDHGLGIGTFVDPRYYSYLGASLTGQAQYLFGIGSKRLVASASWGGGYEYTLPDAETGRRFQSSNLRLGLAMPAAFREKLTGIAATPSLGLTFPTSLESWNSEMITNLSLGVGLSRNFFDKKLNLGANIGGSHGFYASPVNGTRNPTYVAPGAKAPADPLAEERDAFGYLRYVCRTGQAFCASVGMNTAWSMNVGGSVQYRVTDALIIIASYTFSKSWGYAASDVQDEFTPRGVDANGNPVARVGMGQRDRASGVIDVSYQINDHYSLDVGLQTSQTPLTATGQVRFPFFAFGSLADNATQAFFSFSAAY